MKSLENINKENHFHVLCFLEFNNTYLLDCSIINCATKCIFKNRSFIRFVSAMLWW
jgi:hypothetical protein